MTDKKNTNFIQKGSICVFNCNFGTILSDFLYRKKNTIVVLCRLLQ